MTTQLHLTIPDLQPRPALPFSAIPAKPLDWLWPHRIPRGKVTLLAGDPGSGKTALALDLAARLSRGLPMPPQNVFPNPHDANHLDLPSTHHPQSTLLLSPDDNAADTLRPRLDALHANVDLIHTLPDFLTLVPPKLPAAEDPLLPTPLEQLDRTCAALPHLALLIIDPITHYLGLTDKALHPTPGNHAVPPPRSILHALARLAHKHNIAVLLTSRLAKKIPDPALSPCIIRRTLGSLAFASTARSILLLTPAIGEEDPRPLAPAVNAPPSPLPLPAIPIGPFFEPSAPVAPTHFLITIKSNLAELPPTLPLTLSEKILWHPPADLPSKTPRPIPLDSALGQALAFLRSLLADGPVRVAHIQSSATDNAISPGTLRRAKSQLCIDCRWSADSFAWFWALPADPRPIPSLANELQNSLRTSENMLRSFQNPLTNGAL